MTTIAGLTHTISTTRLGILVSLAGWQLAENYHDLSARAIPLLWLALGLWYLIRPVARQHLRHNPVHNHIDAGAAGISVHCKARSFTALLLSLGLAMFVLPCLEIEAYFLSAGAKGWNAVVLIARIYNVVTLSEYCSW